jgi:hypothetical protein
MDKFLNRSHPSSAWNSENTDNVMSVDNNQNGGLLGQLRNAAAVKNNQSHHTEVSSSSDDLWNPYFSRNSAYSISDISLSNRIAHSGKTLQGWKVVDKKRVYTTYRNGKLVQGEGSEGFKLSMGDAPTTKGKKRGSAEIAKHEKKHEKYEMTVERSHNSNFNENQVSNRPHEDVNYNIIEMSKRVKDCYQENPNRNTEFDFCFG